MEKQSTKHCPSCEKIKDVNEFIRPSNGTRSNLYKICNDCWQYERKLEQIRVDKLNKSLTTRRPIIKPVWMVVYKSFP